jgi:hypothetical protein
MSVPVQIWALIMTCCVTYCRYLDHTILYCSIYLAHPCNRKIAYELLAELLA